MLKGKADKNKGMMSYDQFEDFFKENYQAACLIVLRYVPDIQQAEDLVQDIFTMFWEKRSEIRISTNYKHYFFTSVKNYALRVVQQEKFKLSLLPVEILDVEDKAGQPNYLDEELSVEIAKAIDDLPKRCKIIFQLAYLDKLSYQQIADKLKVSKNTVKTQMGIAYKNLRERLKQHIIVP